MWPRVRTVLFWIHLALGLTIALPTGVLCVTGVVLAYQVQIETWFDLHGASSKPPRPGAPALPVEALIDAARKQCGSAPQAITLYRDPTRPAEVELRATRPVYLDVYSGRLIGGHSRRVHQFFETVATWHISLGVSGPHASPFRALVRGANGAALGLVMLGTVLWIPRRWGWSSLRPAVLLRWGVAGRARYFNWHTVVGIWSAIPLLVIVWTGLALSYGWARRLTDWDAAPARTAWRGAEQPTSRVSAGTGEDLKPSNAAVLSLDDLLARAKQQSAGWKSITLYVPSEDSDPVHFAIGMKEYIGIGTIAGLALDRSGGVVYFTHAGTEGLLTPPMFIRYGHTGEVWGVLGQTVAAGASLGGVILVCTGLVLSFRRWRVWVAPRAGINRMT